MKRKDFISIFGLGLLSVSTPPLISKAAVKDNSKPSALVAYPVGSIYLSVNSTNPGDIFGGKWEAWGTGKVPVSVDKDDSSFKTVEKTGGEKTHKLTEAEAPKHNHSFSGTALTTGTQSANHTHTGTSGNQSANHTHTTTTGNNSVNHTHGSTGTVSANHTHTYSYTTGTQGTAITVAQMPSHRHDGIYITSPSAPLVYSDLSRTDTNEVSITDWFMGGSNSSTSGKTGDFYSGTTGSGQAHSHAVNLAIANSGMISANHSHSTGNQSANHTHTGTSGGVSVNHTHTTTTGNNSVNHTHSLTPSGSLGNAGSDTAHNNIQPYITCYMFKRTA